MAQTTWMLLESSIWPSSIMNHESAIQHPESKSSPIFTFMRIHLNLFLTALIAVTMFSCSQKTKSDEAAARAMLDTLEYGETEFNLMVEYFKNDSVVQNALRQQLANGDESAPKFEKLLKLNYENRFDSGLTDKEIDALMLSYYAMKNVRDKFDQIQYTLDTTSIQTRKIRAMTDSVTKSIEKMKKTFQGN